MFYYTIVVILCVMTVAATCLSTYFVSKHKDFLLYALLYITYTFDVALVFRRILNSHKESEETTFAITSAPESILLGALLIIFLWLIVLNWLQRPHWIAAVSVGFYLVGSIFFLLYLPYGGLREFAFYSMRSVAAFTIIIYCVWVYCLTKDPAERARLRSHGPIVVVGAITSFMVVGENIVSQLFLTQHSLEMGIMPERNLSENLLFLLLGAWTLRRCFRLLRLRSKEPPQGSNPAVAEFIEDAVHRFSETFGLSKREIEVLTLVLRGADNKTIANELDLSINTVKVHVHNILHKCNVGTRVELTESFWALS